MFEILQKAQRLKQEEGVREVARRAPSYAFRRAKKPYIEFKKRGSYQETRKRATRERWQLIRERIDSNDVSLVDIGCNAAELTAKAEQEGLVSVGVDRPVCNGIPDAIQKAKELDRLSIVVGDVTPENVDRYSEYDVILLLSVYHHWWRQFGEDGAKSMLESFKGANKVFFEPASKQTKYTAYNESELEVSPPPIEDFDSESIISYNTRHLKSVFGNSYSVSYLGATARGEYRDGDRHLFVAEKIDTS